MADKVDRLTTTYNMDGNLESKAAAAAKEVIRLKQAQSELGTETQKAEQRLTQSASAAERLLGRYIPTYGATQQLTRDTERLNNAFNAGKISAEQHATAMAGIQTKQKQLTDSFTQAGSAIKLQAHQLVNLGQQIQDIGVSLAGGQNPFLVIAQQAPQAAFAVGGFSNLYKIAMAALISPTGLAITSAVALGGSLALVGSRALGLASNAREFSVAIRAMGNDAVTTTGQLQAMVRAMQDQGVAGDEAKAAVMAAARNPRLTQSGMRAVTSGAADFAAAFGGSASDGAKALTDMATGGYDAIKKLDQAYGLLTASQLNEIRLLAEQGKAAQAAEIAFAALQGRINGAARDSMSTGAKAWLDLKRAIDGLIDGLASSAPVVALMERLATALQNVANAVKNGDVIDLMTRSASMFPGLGGIQVGADAIRGLASGPNLPDQIRRQESLVARLRANRSDVAPGLLDAYDEAIVEAERKTAALKARIDETASSATVLNGAVSNGPLAKDSTGKYASDLRVDIDRRSALIGQGAVGQAIGNADIASAREIAANGITGAEADDVKILRRKEALIQLQDAIARTTVLTKIDTAETLKVADAYLQSEGAGRSAMIERQAASDAFTEGANKEARAAELRKKAASEAIVASAQSLFALRQQRDASAAMLSAETAGADAIRETTIRNRVYAETMNERLALDKADADQRPRLLALIKEKTALIKEQMESERQAYVIQQQRQANEQLELAGMERQISLLTDVNERRAASIALARRQQEISLANDSRLTDADRAGLLTKGDQIRALQDQTRFYDEIRQQAQGLASDVSQFLVDGFVNAEKGGKSAFQNLWDGALAGGKRFLAQIAAQFLQQKILLPIAMQIVGGAPGAFGIANPSGASSGGFSLGGVGDIASVGKMIPGVGNWINGAVDSFGAWTGLGASTGILTGATAGAASAAGVGTAGAAIAAETGISAFGTAGGALTGAAGLSAALPYVGAGIMAVSLLTSFLGGKKSVGPGGGIGFGAGADGKINIGFTSQDNGYDPVAKNSDAAQAVVDGALKFFKQIGGTYKGTGVADHAAEMGFDAGPKKYVGGDDTSNGKGRFDTIEQAMAASLIAIVKNSIVEGVSKDIQDRIKAVSTAQDMENLLQYIAGLNQVYDAFKGWKPPLTAAEQAMQQLNAAFDQAKSAADSLSQSTDDLQTSFNKQRAYLVDQFNAPLKERELRAGGQSAAADELVRAREAVDLRKQAAALGADAVIQVEKTLAAERTQVEMKNLADQRAVIDQAIAARQQQLQASADLIGNVMGNIAADLNQALSAWRGVADEVTKFNNALGLSAVSPLSPEAQLALARSQYQDQLSKAMGGDVTAAQGVTGFSQTYLEKARAYYASSGDFVNIFNGVRSDLTGLAGYAGGAAQTSLIDSYTARIASLRDQQQTTLRGFASGGFAGAGEMIRVHPGELVYTGPVGGPTQIVNQQQTSAILSGGADWSRIEAKLDQLIRVTAAAGRMNAETQAQMAETLEGIKRKATLLAAA